MMAFVELAAPTECGGCAEPGVRWCLQCAAVLAAAAPRPWSPTPRPTGLPRTFSGPTYAGIVRRALGAWKDGGRVDLTQYFAPVLAGAVAEALRQSAEHADRIRAGGPVFVIPAPSSPAGTRARGWRPVVEVTRVALARTGESLPLVPAVRLARRVADQSGLNASERRQNLQGAVRVRASTQARLRGVPCLLVDDVVTTGATLAECARALREAGAGPVVAATIAATARTARPTGQAS